jgi:hypothetical protein
MSKLAPKKYGDKITQELTGANGAPIQTQATISKDDIKQAIKELQDEY